MFLPNLKPHMQRKGVARSPVLFHPHFKAPPPPPQGIKSRRHRIGEDDGFVGIVGSCGRGGGTIKGIVFGGRKSGKYGKRTYAHARGREIKLRFSAEDRQNPLARTTGTILPNSHFASFLARIPTYSVQAIRPLRPLVFRRFPLLTPLPPHLFLLAFLRPRGSRRRRKRRKCR